MKVNRTKPHLKKNRSSPYLGLMLSSLLCFILLTSCSSKPDRKENNETNSAELMEAVRSFNDAFAKGKVALLETMITENYQHTNGTSEAIGKENWVSYLFKRQAALNAGTLEIHDYKMDQVRTELFDKSAIVTARMTVDRTQDSIRETKQFRVTTLWVKEGGQWKRAGFHDGSLQ